MPNRPHEHVPVYRAPEPIGSFPPPFSWREIAFACCATLALMCGVMVYVACRVAASPTPEFRRHMQEEAAAATRPAGSQVVVPPFVGTHYASPSPLSHPLTYVAAALGVAALAVAASSLRPRRGQST